MGTVNYYYLTNFTKTVTKTVIPKADIARILGDDEDMMDTYIDVDFGDVLRNFEWGAKKAS